MNRLKAAAVTALLFTCSCATALPGGHTTGFLIRSVDSGGADTYVEGQPLSLEGLERGESREVSFLGLFAWGDSSLDAAAAEGNLKNVHYMDRKVVSFLGIVATYTTIVLGEATE